MGTDLDAARRLTEWSRRTAAKRVNPVVKPKWISVGEAQRAEHGDERLRRHRFASKSVDHREGGAGGVF